MAYDSGRQGVTQTVLFTSTSAAPTSAISSQCYQIRLVADSACCYSIGTGSQTATSASPYLPPNWYEYVTVTPGQFIAAIRAPTDGLTTSTSGTLWVTEII